MKSISKTAILGSMTFGLAACGAAPASMAALPEGETNLSCAAVVYAASNLVDKSRVPESEQQSFSNYLGLITKYGTAHAEEKGMDSQEVLGVIKLEAYRLKGKAGGAAIVYSDEGILKRAKACAGGS
jgi:hypothetical protein